MRQEVQNKLIELQIKNWTTLKDQHKKKSMASRKDMCLFKPELQLSQHFTQKQEDFDILKNKFITAALHVFSQLAITPEDLENLRQSISAEINFKKSSKSLHIVLKIEYNPEVVNVLLFLHHYRLSTSLLNAFEKSLQEIFDLKSLPNIYDRVFNPWMFYDYIFVLSILLVILYLSMIFILPSHPFDHLLIIAGGLNILMPSFMAANFPFKSRNNLYCSDVCVFISFSLLSWKFSVTSMTVSGTLIWLYWLLNRNIEMSIIAFFVIPASFGLPYTIMGNRFSKYHVPSVSFCVALFTAICMYYRSHLAQIGLINQTLSNLGLAYEVFYILLFVVYLVVGTLDLDLHTKVKICARLEWTAVYLCMSDLYVIQLLCWLTQLYY